MEKIEHKNIFEALSAFQGENPEIKKTVEVNITTKTGGKINYSYAPLDAVLAVVRPLLAKHGLSVVFGQGEEKGTIVCSLYHTTYSFSKELITTSVSETENTKVTTTSGYQESGVLRSAPIKVRREGDMKDIGSDSTYARRYVLSEVLGIASDEDKDTKVEEESKKKVESFAYSQIEKTIKGLKTAKEVKEKITFFTEELAKLSEGKTPSVGLKKEQYEALMEMSEAKLEELKTGEKSIDIGSGEVAPENLPPELK